MNCMKCGRETADNQAFCESCLLEMEQHPVKPGTVILLPNQPKQPPKKPVPKKKPTLSPEEQVPLLKKKVWRLRFLALFLILVIGALWYTASRAITELDIQRLLGQNYSTVETEPEETELPTEVSETAEP